jgi:hypothetical protein
MQGGILTGNLYIRLPQNIWNKRKFLVTFLHLRTFFYFFAIFSSNTNIDNCRFPRSKILSWTDLMFPLVLSCLPCHQRSNKSLFAASKLSGKCPTLTFHCVCFLISSKAITVQVCCTNTYFISSINIGRT